MNEDIRLVIRLMDRMFGGNRIGDLKSQLADCKQLKFNRSQKIFQLQEELKTRDVTIPFPESIEFLPNGHITQTWVDYAKAYIEEAGMVNILTMGAGSHYNGVEKIRVVDDITEFIVTPNAVGTVWGYDIILSAKSLWFPSYGLPGAIIHEAAHLWWTYSDMSTKHINNATAINTNEFYAYTVQQVFEWKIKSKGLAPSAGNLLMEQAAAMGLEG